MSKKSENEHICKTTLPKLQEELQTKLNKTMMRFIIFGIFTIWTYFSTSGIQRIGAVYLCSIPLVICFFALLRKYSKWTKYKDMTQKQFLELQMKAKIENEEIAKREMEAANAVKMYRQMNSAYKLGQFLASLFYG